MTSPRGRTPLVDHVPERDGHRRRDVEHVDRAAAPHLVDPVGVAMISPPNGSRSSPGVDRHDVGVAHQAQARRGRVAALDAGDERRPSGRRLPSLDVDARAFDEGLQHVGVAGLLARRRRPVVDALVADQRLQQFDGGVHCWSKIRPWDTFRPGSTSEASSGPPMRNTGSRRRWSCSSTSASSSPSPRPRPGSTTC